MSLYDRVEQTVKEHEVIAGLSLAVVGTIAAIKGINGARTLVQDAKAASLFDKGLAETSYLKWNAPAAQPFRSPVLGELARPGQSVQEAISPIVEGRNRLPQFSMGNGAIDVWLGRDGSKTMRANERLQPGMATFTFGDRETDLSSLLKGNRRLAMLPGGELKVQSTDGLETLKLNPAKDAGPIQLAKYDAKPFPVGEKESALAFFDPNDGGAAYMRGHLRAEHVPGEIRLSTIGSTIEKGEFRINRNGIDTWLTAKDFKNGATVPVPTDGRALVYGYDITGSRPLLDVNNGQVTKISSVAF